MSANLPSWFSVEKFKAMPLEKRHSLWLNAKSKDTPESNALVKAIEGSKIDYNLRGYFTLDDPRTIRMYGIINDPNNRSLCIDALNDGKPALAGIEHLIRDALGSDYCAENGMTQTAGDFVANMVRSQGYVDAGRRDMPEGSVAKTAQFFAPKS